LSAFNYDSNYGKKALTMMYRGIMEQVCTSTINFMVFPFLCLQHSKSWFQGDQDSFPVVPPGCSDDETSIQQFINEAKAALVSVGIIRDAFICKLIKNHLTYVYACFATLLPY
jgi:hypothetical protein